MDYRDTPARRPAPHDLQAGDVLTPNQADRLRPEELRAQGLALEYDGDGMGGTAVSVIADV